MVEYWFHAWMERFGVNDGGSLRRALTRSVAVNELLTGAPELVVQSREGISTAVELVAGKGIDLTGYLGCRHIDCLSKEIDGLFRHAWHYFDIISLPDQAIEPVAAYHRHGRVDQLAAELEAFVLVIARLHKTRALQLVRFDARRPPCIEHLNAHAAEAGINHVFNNADSLAVELASSALISWEAVQRDGHPHLDFTLQSPLFEHTEWGTLCSAQRALPHAEAAIRRAVADAVINKYVAGLSADALAAKFAGAPLGATIPYYRQLLTHKAPSSVGDVAFELSLPVSTGLTTEAIVSLRLEEAASFRRLQVALRSAIADRLKTSGSDAQAVAREIQRDVIEPELLNISEKLKLSRRMAARGAASGIGLGTIAATVGLLMPVTAPVATGLAVGGAIALGAQALKKANDDELATLRDVKMSDLYFLWRGHRH